MIKEAVDQRAEQRADAYSDWIRQSVHSMATQFRPNGPNEFKIVVVPSAEWSDAHAVMVHESTKWFSRTPSFAKYSELQKWAKRNGLKLAFNENNVTVTLRRTLWK